MILISLIYLTEYSNIGMLLASPWKRKAHPTVVGLGVTMRELLIQIREFTEAGIILNHMYLFDELMEKIEDA